MSFKVGDKVIRTVDHNRFFREDGGEIGRPYEITDINYDGSIQVKGIKDSRYYDERKFEKVPLNNPLNRKLYPNRVEYKGSRSPEKDRDGRRTREQVYGLSRLYSNA